MDNLDKMFIDKYLHPDENIKTNSKIVTKLLRKLMTSYILKFIGIILIFLSAATLGFMVLYVLNYDYTALKVLLFIMLAFIFALIGIILTFDAFIGDRVSKNELACINIHFANCWGEQVSDDMISVLTGVAKAFSSKKHARKIGTSVSVYHKVSAFFMRKEIIYGTNLELLKANVDIKNYNGRNAIYSNAAVLATFIISLVVFGAMVLYDKITPYFDFPKYVYLIVLITATVASAFVALIDFIQIMKFLNTSIKQLKNATKEENE